MFQLRFLLLPLVMLCSLAAPAEPMRATAPTVGPSHLRVSVLDCSTARISVRPGNGRGRILVVSEDIVSYASTQPSKGAYYSCNALFAQGDRINADQRSFVVSAGKDTAVTVFGFLPGRQYTVTAYEYNTTPGMRGDEAFPVYESTNNCTARAVCSIPPCLRAEPTKPASIVDAEAFTPTSAVLTLAPGDGNGRLVIIAEPGVELMVPVQNHCYTCPTSQYGRNGTVKPGAHLISASNSNLISVTGLRPGTVYQVTVYEYNASPSWCPVAYLLSQPPGRGIIMTPELLEEEPPTESTRAASAAVH